MIGTNNLTLHNRCHKPAASLWFTRWQVHPFCDVVNVRHVRPLFRVGVDTRVDQLTHLKVSTNPQSMQTVWFSNDVRHNQSINQSINLYRAIVQRHVLQCGYAESKRNVLRQILNVLTDGAVRQFSGREFQSLRAATEKWPAAV